VQRLVGLVQAAAPGRNGGNAGQRQRALHARGFLVGVDQHRDVARPDRARGALAIDQAARPACASASSPWMRATQAAVACSRTTSAGVCRSTASDCTSSAGASSPSNCSMASAQAPPGNTGSKAMPSCAKAPSPRRVNRARVASSARGRERKLCSSGWRASASCCAAR
jgi:hypothetical protein